MDFLKVARDVPWVPDSPKKEISISFLGESGTQGTRDGSNLVSLFSSFHNFAPLTTAYIANFIGYMSTTNEPIFKNFVLSDCRMAELFSGMLTWIHIIFLDLFPLQMTSKYELSDSFMFEKPMKRMNRLVCTLADTLAAFLCV